MTMGKKKFDRRDMSALDHLAREQFWRAAQGQRCCQMCGKFKGHWQAHHVVYEQHLNDIGAPIWCNANSMRLCDDCHRKHHNRSALIPIEKLSDQNIEYAFDTLGVRAYNYLPEKYPGEDERVERELARRERETADGIDSSAGSI